MSNDEDLSKIVDFLTEVYNKNVLLKIEVLHRVVRSDNKNEHESVIKEVTILSCVVCLVRPPPGTAQFPRNH
jgi:hypothetical protein